MRLIKPRAERYQAAWTDYTRVLNLLYHRGWSQAEIEEVQAAIDAACLELEQLCETALLLNEDYRALIRGISVSAALPHTLLAQHLSADDDLTADLREMLRRRREARGPFRLLKNNLWAAPNRTGDRP